MSGSTDDDGRKIARAQDGPVVSSNMLLILHPSYTAQASKPNDDRPYLILQVSSSRLSSTLSPTSSHSRPESFPPQKQDSSGLGSPFAMTPANTPKAALTLLPSHENVKKEADPSVQGYHIPSLVRRAQLTRHGLRHVVFSGKDRAVSLSYSKLLYN